MIQNPQNRKLLINTSYLLLLLLPWLSSALFFMLLVGVQSLCAIENLTGSYFQIVCKAALI